MTIPDDLQALDREEAAAGATTAEASKSESEEKTGVETGADGSKDDKDEGRHSEPGKLVVDSMTRTAVSEMWSICLRLARHTNLLT